MSVKASPRLLRPEDLEREYGILHGTSGAWRLLGKGPDYIRISHRLVLYERDEVERFLRVHAVKRRGE